jgi:homoserine dehydrogenase
MARELGIALLGAGTVGAAVARELHAHADRLAARSGGPLALRHLGERDPDRVRALRLDGVTVHADAGTAVTAPDVDIVVELLGGLEPAGTLLEAALGRGLGVVSANKAVMATAGHQLATAVRPGSGGLAFEAAAGGAMPVLGMLRDSLAGDEIRTITAVINGTTNYILGRLEAGDGFDDAVAEAQLRGYAEADPSADLDGHDAAQKLCLLAWFGMGAEVSPAQVLRRGIGSLDPADVRAAARLQSVIRLVARVERTSAGVALTVQPTLVPRPGHPLGEVEGADNAVLIESDLAGSLLLRGRGAGADAAASAVLSDLVAVARARREGSQVRPPVGAPVPVLDAEAAATCSWLRLGADGAVDTVTGALGRGGVEVERVIRGNPGQEVEVLTGRAPRAVLARVLESIDGRVVAQALDRLEVVA